MFPEILYIFFEPQENMQSGYLVSPQPTIDNQQIRSVQMGLILLPMSVTYRTLKTREPQEQWFLTWTTP